jgi:two-component sensor histidine kinase
VTWRLQDDRAKRRVVLEWRESGVTLSESVVSRRRGYGTELIERSLPYDLGAETRLEFGPDRVHCTIAVPIGG